MDTKTGITPSPLTNFLTPSPQKPNAKMHNVFFFEAGNKGTLSFSWVDDTKFRFEKEDKIRPFFETRNYWGIQRTRTKIKCNGCGRLVGHIYDDGELVFGRFPFRQPPPTGTFLRVLPWVQYLSEDTSEAAGFAAAAAGSQSVKLASTSDLDFTDPSSEQAPAGV